jgi:ribulose-bisphosphate carboxylase small chain
MKARIGAFAHLGKLSDGDIRDQVLYCERQGWAVVVEYTRDPSPGNHYWDRWGLPMLDADDPEAVLYEINACRAAHADCYIRIMACESFRSQARIRHSILVHQPGETLGP